jgi:hypothetical protein
MFVADSLVAKQKAFQDFNSPRPPVNNIAQKLAKNASLP